MDQQQLGASKRVYYFTQKLYHFLNQPIFIMKNHLSLFIFCGIFFFNSCSNSNQNQETVNEQSDSTVLIASNDQNPTPDTPDPENKIEDKKDNQKVEIETPKKSEIKKIEKEVTGIQIQQDAPKKIKKGEIQISKSFASSEKTVAIQNNNEPKTKSEESVANQKEQKLQTSNYKPKTSNHKLQTSNKPPFNHDKWDRLLRKYVSAAGKVNYKGIKTDKATLESYLKELEENPIQDNWSKAKKMAYWINAYNAFTVKMIVDNYPVSSITKLHGGKPWDYKWIKLNGQTYNLNNIENDILRPVYKDSRIHFAVNCAAQSCPPLLNQAWTESNLNQLMDKQAIAFINNPKFNTIKKSEVEISKIFEWYAVDFGIIIDYLNKYSNTKIDRNAKVKYKEYDWNLNE